VAVDPPDTPSRREIDAAYAEWASEIPARLRAPKERVTPGSAFGPAIVREYPGARNYTAAEWIDLTRTSSDHRILPPERREPLLAAVAAAIERHRDTYRHHYVCDLWAAQRREKP
jgi:hypothetical protein